MSENTNNTSTMLKAAGLWAKTSVKSGQYLTGRLGGVRILILENRDRKVDDDPSHHLFFAESPDRLQGAAEKPQERSRGNRSGLVRGHQTRPSRAPMAMGSGYRTPRHRCRAPMALRHRPGMSPTMCRSGRGDPPRAAMMPAEDRRDAMPDAFGPWAAGLDPAERLARLRSLRALVQVFAGPTHSLVAALAQAEGDPGDEAAALAWEALLTLRPDRPAGAGYPSRRTRTRHRGAKSIAWRIPAAGRRRDRPRRGG